MSTAPRAIRGAKIVAPGMVVIPVDVYGAVKGQTTQNGKTVNLHKDCNTPVNRIPVCMKCGVVNLTPDEMVPGVEQSKGVFVPVTFDETEAPKPTRSSDQIEVYKFVTDDLSPLRVKKSYWLKPKEGYEKQYSLLLTSLMEAEVVGFGHAALWHGKEHPVVVQPWIQGLVMHYLHHDEDMIDPGTFGMAPDGLVIPKATEKRTAARYIETFTSVIDPAEITTEARQWRQQQIEQQVLLPHSQLRDADNNPVVDILDQMKASVALTKRKPARKTTKAASR